MSKTITISIDEEINQEFRATAEKLYLKYQELPNFCPKSYDELYSTAENTLVKMKANPRKMKRVIRWTKPPLPSTLGK